ncbi:hypothetical protein F4083_05880 [Candidatus Poribacteria bacterium]|nr:hypothetical protein [Candidatus Poribacteria bacterium]
MYRFLSKAFIVPFIIVVILVLISLIGPSLPLIKGLSGFSLTDVGIIFLAVYTILKKPWGESLAVHFKQAYKKQLDDIAKVVKERDALREKCNTSSFLFQAYDSLESLEKTMREQDGYPIVDDMGKQLWEDRKDKLVCGLSEIENISTSEDAAKILSNYSTMLDISSRLLTEVIKLRQLKTLSKTGEIGGEAILSNEFTIDYPVYKGHQYHFPIRLKPEYVSNGYVSQFWIPMNPFYPKDANTGKKAKKRRLSWDDNWWLLSYEFSVLEIRSVGSRNDRTIYYPYTYGWQTCTNSPERL